MPFLGSPDHFALRLRKKKNWSARETVSAIVAMQLLLSAAWWSSIFSYARASPCSAASLVACFFVVLGAVLAAREDGMNIVIGAGISGLSAGQALGGEFVILEKSGRAGGLSGQYRAGGFAFDHGGHYFHFQDKPEIKEHVERFHAFREYRRDSKIFLRGALHPLFPAISPGLPAGAAAAAPSWTRSSAGGGESGADLEEFLLANFGRAFVQPVFSSPTC